MHAVVLALLSARYRRQMCYCHLLDASQSPDAPVIFYYCVLYLQLVLPSLYPMELLI